MCVWRVNNLRTKSNKLSVEIPEKCIKVYQDNKEETEEVAKKAAVEFLSVKSIKVIELPKKVNQEIFDYYE